jgi:hypothetical protein
LGKERYDDYHVSGFGTSLKAGLNVTFFKHFYIQGELKGYINMQDIRTTQSTDDSASQDFSFTRLIALEVYLKSSLVVKYNLAVGTQQLFLCHYCKFY